MFYLEIVIDTVDTDEEISDLDTDSESDVESVIDHCEWSRDLYLRGTESCETIERFSAVLYVCEKFEIAQRNILLCLSTKFFVSLTHLYCLLITVLFSNNFDNIIFFLFSVF